MEKALLISFMTLADNAASQVAKDTVITPDNLKEIKFHDDYLEVPKTIYFTSNTDSNYNYVKERSVKSISVTNKKAQIKDSLSAKVHEIKKADKNNLLKEQFKKVEPKGTISAGYEYGILPFVINNSKPSGGFKTEGQVAITAMTLPLDITYFYTSVRNVIGLNNYFRVSFNSARYKEQMNKKLDEQTSLNYKKIDKLQIEQQKTMQKMEYLRFLQANPLYKNPNSSSHNEDSVTSYYQNYSSDTSRYNLMPKDTAVNRDSLGSTYRNQYASKNGFSKNDSINRELNKWTGKYDSINETISKIKTEINRTKNLESNPKQLTNPYLSKANQFLGNIKKFEIGLCNPSYSTFLVSNIPLQGINIEYIKSNNFIGVSYGTTVNNLLYNPNSLQGIMQGMRNYYNYFDFGNLSGGRKVFVLKGGPGTLEDSHVHVGFEIGKGQTGSPNSMQEPSSQGHKESNLVFEVDAKYKFSEQLSFDFIVGKSSVKDGNLSFSQLTNAFNEVASTYRSYAMLSRLNFNIKKTSTKLSCSMRWIDPFFKSFGVGFLRTDNVRYEVKAEQPLSKKIKYTIVYRHESDNLLNLYAYKNTLQSINNTLNIKFSRKLNLRLNYVPLLRELKQENITAKDRNHILGSVVTYSPKLRHADAQFNAIYCKNIISSDSANVNFENLTYGHQILWKSGFGNDFNISWFRNNLTDTSNNDVYLATSDICYSAKKRSKFTIGGKMAIKANTRTQYGFKIKAAIKVYKELFWETEAEKIVIGEYYNSLMVEQMKKFPYYCTTKLILNF